MLAKAINCYCADKSSSYESGVPRCTEEFGKGSADVHVG